MRFRKLRDRFDRWYNHMPAAKVRKRLGPERFNDYLKVSCIRNPFDLAISFYYQVKQMVGLDVPEDPMRLREDFRAFVAGRWTNQKNLISIKGEICIDYFIRMEHMREDLETFLAVVGADKSKVALPHAKKNDQRSRDLADYYDRDGAARVRDHMGWVFERFNYSTEILGL